MDFLDEDMEDVSTYILSELKNVQDGSVVKLYANNPVMIRQKDNLFKVFLRLDEHFGVFNQVGPYLIDTLPQISDDQSFYTADINEKALIGVFDWIKQSRQNDLKAEQIVICGDVSLDLSRGIMTIRDLEREVSVVCRPILFIFLLLKHHDVVQRYVEIARFVNLDGFDFEEDAESPDLWRAVGEVRKLLHYYLDNDAGFPSDYSEYLMSNIHVKRRGGYKYAINVK